MGSWRVVGASAQGVSHARENLACQDSHLFTLLSVLGESNPFVVLIAADGAGSASKAQDGSRLACEAALKSLKQKNRPLRDAHAAQEAIRSSFFDARAEIERNAIAENAVIDDYATTLIVTLIAHEFVAIGQIGDGGVVIGHEGKLELIHWPEQEAINLTDFLTGDFLDDDLILDTKHVRTDRCACFTDGLAPLLLDYRNQSAHVPAFEQLFRTCQVRTEEQLSEDLTALLNSEAVNSRTDDDKTLLLAMQTKD